MAIGRLEWGAGERGWEERVGEKGMAGLKATP